MKKHNFSAGPSILPQSVFEKASQSVLNFENSGLSVLEISHRSSTFLEVINKARNLALELSGLTDKGYQALFLNGGASMQFLMVAYNLLHQRAGYINSGLWSDKAIKEAQILGEVQVIASSKEDGYRYIPIPDEIPQNLDYLHITTNNTIYGTQFQQLPKTQIPLVADMSSDIFSREMDYSQFGLIYAGAQKNLGPAGTTLVLVREDILGKVQRKIPTLLNYQNHIQNQSMANTPTTFAIYTALLTMQWLKDEGGIASIEQKNKQKAQLLYQEIDRNPLFEGYANPNDRSMMNAVFTLTQPQMAQQFDALCQSEGICNLKGHRTLGGYRASIYNAMPLQSVQTLVDVMKFFEQKQ